MGKHTSGALKDISRIFTEAKAECPLSPKAVVRGCRRTRRKAVVRSYLAECPLFDPKRTFSNLAANLFRRSLHQYLIDARNGLSILLSFKGSEARRKRRIRQSFRRFEERLWQKVILGRSTQLLRGGPR